MFDRLPYVVGEQSSNYTVVSRTLQFNSGFIIGGILCLLALVEPFWKKNLEEVES